MQEIKKMQDIKKMQEIIKNEGPSRTRLYEIYKPRDARKPGDSKRARES